LIRKKEGKRVEEMPGGRREQQPSKIALRIEDIMWCGGVGVRLSNDLSEA